MQRDERYEISHKREHELEDRLAAQEDVMRGYLYTIASLKFENEFLKKKLSEADRTSTFYRYHKGAKS